MKYRMYLKGVGRLPVVDRDDPEHLVRIISRSDVMKAYELASGRIAE